jgi:hypothetical protein
LFLRKHMLRIDLSHLNALRVTRLELAKPSTRAQDALTLVTSIGPPCSLGRLDRVDLHTCRKFVHVVLPEQLCEAAVYGGFVLGDVWRTAVG